MYKRILSIIFCVVFVLCISLPLLFTNLKDNVVSESENRYLTAKPKFYGEDGTLNKSFFVDFEGWFNDNVGFRDEIVVTNAKIQYNVFHQLSNNTDYWLGPKGEFNYATDAIIADYQHFNLKDEETLDQIAESYQFVSDWLEEQDIQFYYFQCWDKHSIYPEQFPNSVNQYGDMSKTEQFVAVLEEETDIHVVNPMDALVEGKRSYETYSQYGDPTHWTRRGAYIGYLELMQAINAENDNKYKVLRETDYDLSLTDQGNTVFGGIHEVNMLEKFVSLTPTAYQTDEKLSLYADDERHRVFTNDAVDNDTRVLVLGDSYINSFIIDDLAESFHETYMIWGDYTVELEQVIEAYQPDIVICENAERCDRTGSMIKAAQRIQGIVEE